MFQQQFFQAMSGSLIITFVSLILTFAIIFFVFRRVMGGIKQQNQLLMAGMPAEATVLRLQDTGVKLNDNPQVKILLEVRPIHQPAYEVETNCFVSYIKLPQVQPGSVVQVRIDPVNPQRVAVALA